MTRLEVLRNERKEINQKMDRLNNRDILDADMTQDLDNLKIRKEQLDIEIYNIESTENHADKTNEIIVKDKSKIYRLAEKASIIGDTVGDPLKDTSGPSLNILIKLSSIISLVFGSLFVSTSYLLK
jgi:hypothetical protein